jgi:prepilin-type processing-associated H-X9-DG protein
LIHSGSTIYPFKSAQVRNPSGKIMIAEPVAVLKPTDSPSLDNNWVVETGRWEPFTTAGAPHNWLTLRHNGKSVCTFADGHVQPIPWWWGTNAINSQADL